MIKRRQFITLLGSAAAWPLAARAQQLTVPVIGLLGGGAALAYAEELAGLRAGLREAGFVEGQSIEIEYRWAEGNTSRLPGLAAELVNRPVQMMVVANGTATALAAKVATNTIPIVFVLGGDPVESSVVGSINRPGGNITGVTTFSETLIVKRLEIVRELVPHAPVIAMLLNSSNANYQIRLIEITAAARSMGQTIRVLNAANVNQIDDAFAVIAREQISALVVQFDPLFVDERSRLAALAAKNGVAAIYQEREFVERGGLISYGASQRDAYHQAGIYVGRILKGAKPADMPVVRPTKFNLVINLRAARALGLAIPPTLLAIADEVIE